MRIGVDVGGTHTDAVIVSGSELLAAAKVVTSTDIEAGVLAAVREVLAQAAVAPAQVQLMTLGTTQLTNAVVERRDLEAVGVLRIGAQSSSALPIAAQWPADLAAAAVARSAMVDGGHEYDGSPIVPLDEAGLIEAMASQLAAGIEAFAITSVFATANPAAEIQAAALVRQRCPLARVSCSHELGRLGLYQRENANLLNAALLRQAERVFGAFERAFRDLALSCPLFISQNDGTLMAASYARRFPVLTFSSGPTNSMRGAAFLSGELDAMVVDVGGTTSDIGMLQNGFPRPSGSAVRIGGVLTNFRMPDVLALGIGGGSLVSADGTSVGPRSVGRDLLTQALVFAGPTLTATDLAVASGLADIGDASAVAGLSSTTVRRALTLIRERYETTLDVLKTSAGALPLIVVGGGGFLVPEDLAGVSATLRPDHADVANAIGAAFAQVSGEADVVYASARRSRDDALAEARSKAQARAVAAGAIAATVQVMEVEETPMSYMAEPGAVIQVRAIGEVDVDRFAEGGIDAH